MAERGVDQKEEKKSYGSVFVIGAGFLVVLSLWAFVDDNITRRPWKGFQAQFYRLDYNKAKAAYDEEDKKLQADDKYKELTKKLAGIPVKFTQRRAGKKLKALEAKRRGQRSNFKKSISKLRIVKSEVEEAWYEHDHAVQQKRNPRPYLRSHR